MEYKIGSRITIIDKDEFKEALTGIQLCVCADSIRGMMEFCNKEATIVDIDSDGDFILDIDGGTYCWSKYEFVEYCNA